MHVLLKHLLEAVFTISVSVYIKYKSTGQYLYLLFDSHEMMRGMSFESTQTSRTSYMLIVTGTLRIGT